MISIAPCVLPVRRDANCAGLSCSSACYKVHSCVVVADAVESASKKRKLAVVQPPGLLSSAVGALTADERTQWELTADDSKHASMSFQFLLFCCNDAVWRT